MQEYEYPLWRMYTGTTCRGVARTGPKRGWGGVGGGGGVTRSS